MSPFDSYTGANAQGRQLFDEGKQLLRNGDQTAACAKFAAAYKEEEATSTQLNVARCRENEGKHAEAWRMFQDAAVRARSAGFEDRAKIAIDAATGLEERLGTVVIRLATPIAPGTVVTVNDRIVETAPEVRELVDPGNVKVVARGPTGVTSSKVFRIFVKNTMKVDVPTLQERTAGRQPVWIAVSAIAFVGGAIALGAGSGGVRLVGGVSMVGGVALFLLAPRVRTTVVPMLVSNESGTGLALGGRF
jgi:predicted  nucleic acid-binding Zn-ribbon protein